MKSGLKIKIESSLPEIKDFLTQLAVNVPDCDQFLMSTDNKSTERKLEWIEDLTWWELNVSIIADRELVQSIMELTETANVDKCESIVTMSF